VTNDDRTHLETLRREAEEATLISALATVAKKRDLFAKLAANLNMLAAEVERAMAAVSEEASGIAGDAPRPQSEFDRYGSLAWQNHRN
jgi:hypothetical protein